MCGIVAYRGNQDSTVDTLLSGLKSLEYRGYDSAGLAIQTGQSIYTQKAVGKVSALERAINTNKQNHRGKVGIAHTRWATHGAATLTNAHPHSSANKKIWLVHNGIIENYRQLKQNLQTRGIKLKTDTDTEIIAQLIGSYYRGDLRAAVLKTISKLSGAFAFCVIGADEPDRIIGVKMASPLVVGLSNGELIIASDVSAIIEHTKQVIYLEDGELIDINDGQYEIVNFQNRRLNKKINRVDWDLEAATKEGYEHYLLKEIMEQPRVIKDSIRGRLVEEEGTIKFGGLIDVTKRLKQINQVVLLGVGTSYYSAKMGELYFNALTDKPSRAVLAPEFRYGKYNLDKKTWVIALSQSGETADTIAAVTEARRQGALVTGIVNTVGSTVARITDAGVYNHIGPEISVASTKAFTSQSLLLLMHALLLGRESGLDFNVAQKIITSIQTLPADIEKILKSKRNIELIAKQLAATNNLLYIGRQYNYPIALEGALKIKEIAYVHAEGLSGGELKHGFIALIEPKTATIALATEDGTTEKMLANIAEVKARRGRVIAIANHPLEEADETIIVPRVASELLQPLLNNIVLQLLAYFVAKHKKLPIDQPRNLAKSVTVE